MGDRFHVIINKKNGAYHWFVQDKRYPKRKPHSGINQTRAGAEDSVFRATAKLTKVALRGKTFYRPNFKE